MSLQWPLTPLNAKNSSLMFHNQIMLSILSHYDKALMPRSKPRQLLRPIFLFTFSCCLALILYNRMHDIPNLPALAYSGPYVANTTEAQHGFLPLQEAQDLCLRRRMDIFVTRDRPRKVYDLFLINTELDWLEIRLNELWVEVDYFIIVEAATTFQEGTKPMNLLDNWSRFKPFHSKMVHHVLNITGSHLKVGDTWEHERFQRNALFDQALLSLSGEQAPTIGDVLLVSDVDEIPRPSTIQTLRNCAFPPRVMLRSQFYYYSFQWQHRGEQWAHPQATYYNGVSGTIRPDNLRAGSGPGLHIPKKPDLELYNAAWHCSSCMPSLDDLITKITSFSHKGYNQPYFTHRRRLLRVVRYGIDLFERQTETYDRVDDNPDIPSFLKQKEAQRKFAYLLDRDPESGNFNDADRLD